VEIFDKGAFNDRQKLDDFEEITDLVGGVDFRICENAILSTVKAAEDILENDWVKLLAEDDDIPILRFFIGEKIVEVITVRH
jgi:hypothetical protein